MVPVPVPVFVPIPLHLFTQYTPVPLGMPVPVSDVRGCPFLPARLQDVLVEDGMGGLLPGQGAVP